MSKIQFESKSQPVSGSSVVNYDCKNLCQRYNLKANHNNKIYTISGATGKNNKPTNRLEANRHYFLYFRAG